MNDLMREIVERAVWLMGLFGLHDWEFRFNRRLGSIGLCRFPGEGTSGVIELSAPISLLNDWALIEDTIRHEVAHALAWLYDRTTDHGPTWVMMCERVGAIPEPTSTQFTLPAARWLAKCPGCGMEYRRHRRPKKLHGWHCRPCGREAGKLTWVCRTTGPARQSAAMPVAVLG